MIQWDADVTVYLHREPVDFRKAINGLSVIVEQSMELDAFLPSLFVFINRCRNRIKILYWHKNGFCLWHKRLEQDKFAWPKKSASDTITISSEQLEWLLSGFDIWRSPPHPSRYYTSVT